MRSFELSEKQLDNGSNTRQVPFSIDTGASRTLLWIGRCLLILSVVSLSTMPFTQHLWTWDRFLHGGQDFESGALMVLIFLSLVLVVSKHSKQCVDLLLAQWHLLGFHLTGRESIGIPLYRTVWALQIKPVPSPDLGNYSTPIRI